jgi:hypothetical protein
MAGAKFVGIVTAQRGRAKHLCRKSRAARPDKKEGVAEVTTRVLQGFRLPPLIPARYVSGAVAVMPARLRLLQVCRNGFSGVPFAEFREQSLRFERAAFPPQQPHALQPGCRSRLFEVCQVA